MWIRAGREGDKNHHVTHKTKINGFDERQMSFSIWVLCAVLLGEGGAGL